MDDVAYNSSFFYVFFMDSVIDRVKLIISPIAKENKVKIINVAYFSSSAKFKTLQIMIDKVDYSGVNVQDCELFSNEISSLLDVEDFIDDKYILEVSSPGMDRLLVDNDDYIYYKGYLVNVKLNSAVENRIKFKGFLESISDDGYLTIIEDKVARDFPLEMIYSVRLDKNFVLKNNNLK